MQCIAHPGVIQVAEEELSHQAGVGQIDEGSPAENLVGLIEEIVFRVDVSGLLPHYQHKQKQQQGVKRQDRGKPGEVFRERGTIKAGFL